MCSFPHMSSYDFRFSNTSTWRQVPAEIFQVTIGIFPQLSSLFNSYLIVQISFSIKSTDSSRKYLRFDQLVRGSFSYRAHSEMINYERDNCSLAYRVNLLVIVRLTILSSSSSLKKWIWSIVREGRRRRRKSIASTRSTLVRMKFSI